MSDVERGGGVGTVRWWWGVLLVAVAAAGWFVQEARPLKVSTGLVERFFFPVESNVILKWLSRSTVLSTDGRIARAAGSGHVFRSVDGGLTWDLEMTPADDNRFMAVAQSADGRRAIAVGNEGRIAVTVDGGAGWRLQDSRTKVDLSAIALSSDGMRGLVPLGPHDTGLLRTQDGGSTWSLVPTTEAVYTAALGRDGQAGLMVARNAASGPNLWRTTDGGGTWTLVADLPFVSPGAVGLAAEGRHAVAIAGDARHATSLFSSGDGGMTWRAVPWEREHAIAGVALSADGQVVAVGTTRDNLLSRDGGATWATILGGFTVQRPAVSETAGRSSSTRHPGMFPRSTGA